MTHPNLPFTCSCFEVNLEHSELLADTRYFIVLNFYLYVYFMNFSASNKAKSQVLLHLKTCTIFNKP